MISIIIPVHNGAGHLEECLKRVFASTYQDYEVIIADDCSSDASDRIARAYAKNIIRLPERRGPAAARNAGSQSAGGEILLFIDSDIFIMPDTLQRIADFLRENGNIDAVTGIYSARCPYVNFSSRYKNLYLRYKFTVIPEFTCAANTALLAVRRSSFEKAGRFDPDVSTCEDFEFSQRFAAAGFKIYNDKGLEVAHSRYFSLFGLIRDDFIKAVNMAHLFFNRRNRLYRHPGERGALSIGHSQMAAVTTTFLLFIFFCLLPFFSSAWLIAACLMLGVFTLACNFSFWRFQWRGQSMGFKAASFSFTYIEHLISAFAVLFAAIRMIAGKTKGDFRP